MAPRTNNPFAPTPSPSTTPPTTHELQRTVLPTPTYLTEVQNVRTAAHTLAAALDHHSPSHSPSPSPAADADAVATLRARVGALRLDASWTTDPGARALKTRHSAALGRDIRALVQRGVEGEREARRRAREELVRQVRVVRPGATEEEVRAVVEGGGVEGGVFRQALLSHRQDETEATLGLVQARQNELERVEEVLTELVQLFEEVDMLIVQQEDTVEDVDKQAERAADYLVKGNDELGGAVEKARSRRRMKWWCALVTVLIILIVIIAVVVALRPWEKKS